MSVAETEPFAPCGLHMPSDRVYRLPQSVCRPYTLYTQRRATVPSPCGPSPRDTGWQNTDGAFIFTEGTGAIYSTGSAQALHITMYTSSSAAGRGMLQINASASNSIYSSATTVQPKSLNVQYLIKY